MNQLLHIASVLKGTKNFLLGAGILLAASDVIGQQAFSLCANDSLTLNLTGSSGAVQWEYSSNGTTWAPIPFQSNPTLVTKPSGPGWYRAMVTDGTCDPLYSDTTEVQISTLQADAGADQGFCSAPVTIGGPATGGTGPYTYQWTPSAGLSNPAIASPTASPASATTYVVAVTDAAGCTDMDTVVVSIGSGGGSGTLVFLASASAQTFTVPACVSSITIEAYGAQGGNVTTSSIGGGGLGAIMIGTFAVTPGQVLTVVAGQRGSSEQYSSGGGGGSGVASGTTPLIIAGGGGGQDFQNINYALSNAPVTNDGNPGSGGGGAGGTAGSDGGDWVYSGNNFSRGGRGWLAGSTGSFGQNGSSPNTVTTQGVFGLGGGGGSVGNGWCNCGAGGGGYSGGGSGNINTSGGGGGSYSIGTNQNNTPGANAGDGRVVISW